MPPQETASAPPSSPLSPRAPPLPHSLPTASQQDHSTASGQGRCVTAHSQREEALKRTMQLVPSSISPNFFRGSESQSLTVVYINPEAFKKTFRNFLNTNIIVLYPKPIPQNIRKKVLTPQKNLAIPRIGKL